MRNIYFISLLTMSIVSCAKNQEEINISNIKGFYRYYILETDKTFPQIKFNEDTLHKYCTNSFIKKWYNAHEYDKVLQAQDYYLEWYKNIVVTPINSINNSDYNVCFSTKAEHCIIVTLREENGKWKIFSTKKID